MVRRQTTAVLLAMPGFVLGVSAAAFAQGFAMQAHVIVAGSSLSSSGPCFRLEATIAEPVAGYSSSADYTLRAGFTAAAPLLGNDTIFANGFEECAP